MAHKRSRKRYRSATSYQLSALKRYPALTVVAVVLALLASFLTTFASWMLGDAVDADEFRIYAVSHVDDCLSLLTGMEAGEPDDEGRYPEGTVNRRIVERLAAMADRRIALARSSAKDDEDRD